MKTLRYFLISFSWLPIIALGAWWAGFMPFPTRPQELGSESHSLHGLNASDMEHHVLISADSARAKAKDSPYGLGSWYCEREVKELCHIYETSEVPFFGWSSPSWVFIARNGRNGTIAIAVYGTYAACKWSADRKWRAYAEERATNDRWAAEHNQKPDDRPFDIYSCVRMPK
jgi:hypothetical protein